MARIKQLPTPIPVTNDLTPSIKTMTVYDDLATVTTAGYLNQVDLQSNPVSTTDVIQTLYSFDDQTQVGNYTEFTVSISNGIITLTEVAASGLDGDAGNIVFFNGSGGSEDLGIRPSDPTQDEVASIFDGGDFVVRQLMVAHDVNGTIAPPGSGIAGPLLPVDLSMGGPLGNGTLILVPTTNVGRLGLFITTMIAGNFIVGLTNSNAIPGNVTFTLPPQVSGDTTSNLLATSGLAQQINPNSSIRFGKTTGTEAANVVTASAQSVMITTSSLTVVGGATYVITWTNTFIPATGSSVFPVFDVQWQGGTNTNANFTVSIVANGAGGSAVITIHNNAAATDISGTIILGITVV